MIDLASQLFFTEEKMKSTSFLKEFLKKMSIAKNDKKPLNKNLLMSAED